METLTKRQKSIKFFEEQKKAKKEEQFGYVFLTYENIVAVFGNRGYKPLYHYRFNDLQKLEDFVQQKKEQALKEQQRLEEYKKKGQAENDKIQIGTILVASWGYEQTNIDFYQVVGKTKGGFVTLQKIAQNRTYGDFSDRGNCTPIKDKFLNEEPLRRKLNKFGGVSINSYTYAGVWDGREIGWSSYH